MRGFFSSFFLVFLVFFVRPQRDRKKKNQVRGGVSRGVTHAPPRSRTRSPSRHAAANMCASFPTPRADTLTRSLLHRVVRRRGKKREKKKIQFLSTTLLNFFFFLVNTDAPSTRRKLGPGTGKPVKVTFVGAGGQSVTAGRTSVHSSVPCIGPLAHWPIGLFVHSSVPFIGLLVHSSVPFIGLLVHSIVHTRAPHG